MPAELQALHSTPVPLSSGPRVPQPQPWAAPSTREREAQPSAASRPASCACTPPGDSGARKAALSQGSVNALAKATRKRTCALSPPGGQQWNNRAWGEALVDTGYQASWRVELENASDILGDPTSFCDTSLLFPVFISSS